jgi:uncharacterized small protein (DUF1192 family)
MAIIRAGMDMNVSGRGRWPGSRRHTGLATVLVRLSAPDLQGWRRTHDAIWEFHRMDEPAQPRQARGAIPASLAREDLDLYSVEELDHRVVVLETEIARVRAARERKLSGRAAADALFSRRPD